MILDTLDEWQSREPKNIGCVVVDKDEIQKLKDKIIGIKNKTKSEFNKILYMKYGDINLKGATLTSRFEEKIKKYKFKKNDAVILHISIPESNIVSLVNIEPITQKGIRQVIKEADEYKVSSLSQEKSE